MIADCKMSPYEAEHMPDCWVHDTVGGHAGKWTEKGTTNFIIRSVTALGDLYEVFVGFKYKGAYGGGLGALERAKALAGRRE